MTYGFFVKKYFNIICIRQKPEPDPPYILLSNHYFYTDAFFIAEFLKHPVHYLGSDEITNIFQQVLDKLVGLTYIEKGKIDPGAVMNLFRIIKSKSSIGIFPEGDGSWDGETIDFSMKIIKLLKRLNVPIVTVRNKGGFLTKPRWSDKFRRGKIFLEFDAIDLDTINKSIDKELYDIIRSKIYNNELKNPEVNAISYKGNDLSNGIQFLLWKCPACNYSDTIYGHKNKIICRNCGSEWNLNCNLKIEPFINNLKDIKDWSDWQKNEIKESVNKSIDENQELTKSKNVILRIYKKTKKRLFIKKIIYSEYANGDLILTKSFLKFIPYPNKEEMIFEIKDIKYFVECVNKFVKFYYNDLPFIIEFKNKNSSRYIHFLKELQKNIIEK